MESWLISSLASERDVHVKHNFSSQYKTSDKAFEIIIQQIDAVILDFSKAFDKVSHRHLLLKLEHYGIRGPTLSWIGDFLTNRTQRVMIEGTQSETAPMTSEVPQGSVLGLLLFLCYINDLPTCVSSDIRLFADDCLLYRTIHSQ